MRPALVIPAMLAVAMVSAAQPKKTARPMTVPIQVMAPFSVGPVSATPASLSFQAADPDGGPVTAGPATLTWTIDSGTGNRNWVLTVQSGSPTLTGCNGTLPVSAVTVACGSVGGPGGCSGAFSLSTAPQQIASGNQRGGTRTYTVTVNFLFTDSWRYVADVTSCSTTLIYAVTAL